MEEGENKGKRDCGLVSTETEKDVTRAFKLLRVVLVRLNSSL